MLCFAVFAAIAAVYVFGLDDSPVYLLNDEVNSALHAYSLATTGRSKSGDFLPLYFTEPEFPAGRDPVLIYATALFLKVMPLSEVSVRLPTAAAGVLSLALIWMAASRLFRVSYAGPAAALLLAFTPAFFIHSRLGISVIWPVPFVLGWLWLLAVFADTRKPKTLYFSTLSLGASCFAYLGFAAVAPIFLLATQIWLYASGERRPRCYVLAICGFVTPLLLLVYSYQQHPERYNLLFHYYTDEATALTVDAHTSQADGLRALLGFGALQKRVSTYWNYFNPNLLFVAGDESPRYSTTRAGVFAVSLALLIPLGVRRVVTAVRHASLGWLLIGCFFITPAIASLEGVVQIKRVLPLLPLGVLLSVAGLEQLFSDSRRRWVRVTGLVLAAAIPLQFTMFAFDYFGHYRLRSSFVFGGNLRGALRQVIHEADGTGRRIYLSTGIPNVHIYWRFYAYAEHANALVERASFLDPADAGDARIPSGSLLVALTDDLRAAGAGAASWRMESRIYELDGPTFYTVFEHR